MSRVADWLFDRVDIGPDTRNGQLLLSRWRIMSMPLFGIKVHRIVGIDDDRFGLHNHPWPFVSIRLGRKYREVLAEIGADGHGPMWTRCRRVSIVRANQLHRVTHVPGGGSWTLVLNGRRSTTPWGFQTSSGPFMPAAELFGELAHTYGARRPRKDYVMTDTIAVYTDGACSGNPGPGGWAWVVPFQADDEPKRFRSGLATHTTNQRMELQAALEALIALRSVHGHDGAIEVVTDSRYLVDCFAKRWYAAWLSGDRWLTGRGEPVKNRDLWESLLDVAIDRSPAKPGEVRGRALPVAKQRVTFRWVKGHSGDQWNDMADTLAVAARINASLAAQGRHRSPQ